MLAAFGYGITNEPGEADLWVLNSCAVKAPSEHAFNNMIEKGQIAGKKLVLAGCVRMTYRNGFGQFCEALARSVPPTPG